IGNEQQPLSEADGAGIGDALHDEVSGVLDGRQRPGVLASGRTVERCGSPAVQGLVRSLVVVQPAESVKGPLLGDARRARWANGLTLESFVHALVSAILVRRGRENPLVPNAQAQPPHVQLREPMNPGGREGHPIVRANRAWQPMLAK